MAAERVAAHEDRAVGLGPHRFDQRRHVVAHQIVVAPASAFPGQRARQAVPPEVGEEHVPAVRGERRAEALAPRAVHAAVIHHHRREQQRCAAPPPAHREAAPVELPAVRGDDGHGYIELP